jgi:DNA gyrase/topoisomerase IV subunit A
MPVINAKEGVIEYSKHWIKACMYNYLKGRGSIDQIQSDIHKAKTQGISNDVFQIIIDSLPFDRQSARFKDIIKLLRKDWDYPDT